MLHAWGAHCSHRASRCDIVNVTDLLRLDCERRDVRRPPFGEWRRAVAGETHHLTNSALRKGLLPVRYLALACDYDGTIAHHGHVDDLTMAALERVRASGRKLLLVTGRELDELMTVFPNVQIFDRIVAENGALLYNPQTRQERLLAAAPPSEFVHELERRGVGPISVGRIIVATWEPHDKVVHEVIREMALDLQVIFNKGAVMVLPSGMNKTVGLTRALDELKLSMHNAVAVGDAENDHAFLTACECGVAVANALESVKSRVDWVTDLDHGAGVTQLIDRLIATDLAELSERLTRHDLPIGSTDDGADVKLPAHGGVILVAGPSGAGKSSVTTALLERLSDANYQFCVVDPEGDYSEVSGAVELRGGDMRALATDAVHLLDKPAHNAVLNLLDMRLEDRPEFFQRLLLRLLELRSATARPHWIVVDEAHHLLPSKWQPADASMPAQLRNTVLVTVHPDDVSPSVLNLVETLIVVSKEPQTILDAFNKGNAKLDVSRSLPPNADGKYAWLIGRGAQPVRFQPAKPAADRRRHQRKYALGELGEDRSFYFRGPDRRLNLRAQNLGIFMQIADGVDDDTWVHHLRAHDVSDWFRESIKDYALAADAETVEGDTSLNPRESRARIREAIERRYSAGPQ